MLAAAVIPGSLMFVASRYGPTSILSLLYFLHCYLPSVPSLEYVSNKSLLNLVDLLGRWKAGTEIIVSWTFVYSVSLWNALPLLCLTSSCLSFMSSFRYYFLQKGDLFTHLYLYLNMDQ